jgi:aryl-alcohol dehydrogenase-like predicted oxidoreductase
VRHGGPGYEELTLTTLRELRALAAEVAQPLATIALAWLLHREAVAAVIVGGREPAQVTRNLAAVDLRLSKEALARIDRITAPLKAAFGANADMWDNDANSRIR